MLCRKSSRNFVDGASPCSCIESPAITGGSERQPPDSLVSGKRFAGIRRSYRNEYRFLRRLARCFDPESIKRNGTESTIEGLPSQVSEGFRDLMAGVYGASLGDRSLHKPHSPSEAHSQTVLRSRDLMAGVYEASLGDGSLRKPHSPSEVYKPDGLFTASSAYASAGRRSIFAPRSMSLSSMCS